MVTGEQGSDDPWAVGPALLPGGKVAFLKFTRAHAGRPKPGYPAQASVRLQLLAPNENGQAGPDEKRQLEAVEGSLVAAAGDDACYVGFTTHSARRTYLLYARSTDWLRRWREEHADEVELRAVSVLVRDEPDWRTYQELLEMATEAMSDMQVFMKVRELDADMARPRRVDWALLFPGEAEARSALLEIEAEDPDLSLSLAPDVRGAKLSASKLGVLDLGFMLFSNALMRSVAKRNAGTLDGWGATVETTPRQG